MVVVMMGQANIVINLIHLGGHRRRWLLLANARDGRLLLLLDAI